MITTIPYSQLTPELAAKGCFVTDMPNDEYHCYPAISKSGLDLVERSPEHYEYRVPRSSTRAMEIGTAIHAAILEPDRFKDEYVLLKDTHVRTASEYKQAIKAHSSEKVLVSHEADKVSGMQESIYANQSAASLLKQDGHRELSVFATDPETGVLLKCRFDLLTTDYIGVDLKKTTDIRPEKFSRSVYDYRYHVQDAFYSYVFELAAGFALKAFKILAVEVDMPNPSHVYQLDDEAKAEGNRAFRRNLETYAKCAESKDWHGYNIESELLSLPTWIMNQIENELDDAFDAGD